MPVFSHEAGPAQKEREQIKACQAGDVNAFADLIVPYQQQVYHIGLQMLHDPEDAADMLQETMLKAYRGLPSFRGDARFSTWLYRIAVNCCRDLLRKAYKQKERPFCDFLGEEDGEGEAAIADYSFAPEQAVLEGESHAYLCRLIEGLSPKYRLTVLLREFCGLSYEEIGRITNVSQGTVKSRISRARAAMSRQALQDAEQFPQASRLTGQRREQA
ncbi:MAG: sigma-70 family RNA polymerase sigma factor [Firmicutes bacterium]|nr:sigma-70 family RNA polymerase sigma factor [Bacillota bacterium]